MINNIYYYIHTAARTEQADLVIKNGKIIDVFNGEIIEEDVAITNGKIVGIGSYRGNTYFDAKGCYICPTFIDGHVHIESSMLIPQQLEKVLVPHGVTTLIADPHEIANVSGTEGIQYLIDNSKQSLLDIYFMIPSCVPATPFENAGAVLEAEDITPFYNDPNVLGLAEVMDFPSVLNGNEKMVNKLTSALQSGKLIDGHAAGLNKYGINTYRAAGIQSDHEAVSAEEAKIRLQRGMYLMIRQGSVAKDLEALLPVVTERNARRCLFVTDDKHLDDLVEEGSIDHNVRLAIANGMDPIQAISMATLNTAECFQLKNKGAIAPGFDADLLIISDLHQVTIEDVFLKGKHVVQKGILQAKLTTTEPKPTPVALTNSVNINPVTQDDLKIILSKKTANIIEVIPNSLITNHLQEEVDIEEKLFVSSIEKDQLKLAVIERHKQTGNIGLGIVKGMKLKEGAIATTVAHDSHNIIVCGTNDSDIVKAISEIEDMQGGIAIVKEGKLLNALPLPISGLLTDQDYKITLEQMKSLNTSLSLLGFSGDFNPFLTLSFLALPVIPDLKLTDTGLFHVKKFKHISV
ncbi:adenine deaminase [Alkalihalobacterium alkalinitrilicum]|uniref:adenine deaminase n=1 Tax=Alkalihalobacterium alkalinitrilicum TaxID=427920 RepID=UPI000994C6F2|nr:adenine deaminase [Alkalihalobacterium alkalinitrilicum]